jgi:hypothetical protein
VRAPVHRFVNHQGSHGDHILLASSSAQPAGVPESQEPMALIAGTKVGLVTWLVLETSVLNGYLRG